MERVEIFSEVNMSLRDQLLEAKNRYCAATNRAASGVGKDILNDTKFFDELEAGRSCTTDTYDKVMAWFQKHTPKTTKKRKR